jgi:hypothetical protein
MKKSELKKVLKPIIKECIREALFEEGVLSGVVSEVVKGLGVNQQTLVENKQDDHIETMQLEEKQNRSQKLLETRKKMLDAIGQNSYNGVDLFEGTTAVAQAGDPNANSPAQGPLAGVRPHDPGIDISSLMGNSRAWKAMIK